MKSKLYTFRSQLSAFFALTVCWYSTAQNPFNCDHSAYLFQYNDVYAIDLASGNSYQIASDVTPGNINAAAYNPADGFIWGSLSSPTKSIVRIGNDFSTDIFYIDELPTNNRYVGDISEGGVYYLKGGGTTYYRIDLDPNSVNYTQHLSTESLSQNINIHDWAFNAVDGQLYTVEKNTNKLYRINPDNGQVSSLGVVPILAGNSYTYGAVYFDADGRFYVSANQTGTIYVIQAVQEINGTNGMDSNLFAFGPSSASNDGARCPTAPVAQEICDNGIDDDGDGLIDCEDPSCSGYGTCDEILPPTTGGNDGGLESNNRLSEQINKRNFQRIKTGYNFDRAAAPRLIKDQNYGQRSENSSFSLSDFIPLNVIGETETINSSPSDLLNITNATEIFAVDYLNNNTAIASILALKTEDGVYEHTKYICDRLLGAELISVSTMDIDEQPFIRSIIKNIDGTNEFVLGFSARVANNESNFVIDSHWNLDQYEANATYYNFQIWANSVDDLYLLGQEVLNLLNVEKPISGFNNSAPPSVFVRKGKYSNGELDLQIINTNNTQNVNLDAGLRITETTSFESISSNIDLNGQFITNSIVETGSLFDIGFRIGDGISTPDDLFLSDGPWGIDDSQQGTFVNSYQVTPNDYEFDSSELPVERNVDLTATTSTYFAAYRALTPRFKPVDLSNYNLFKFRAKGNGNLEIAFVKESITNWEDQLKTSIALTDNMQEYIVDINELQVAFGAGTELNDVVTIVFTMAAENGMSTTKTMSLNDIRFAQANTLSLADYVNDGITLKAYPNPMTSSATIEINASTTETIQMLMYNQLGVPVYQGSHSISRGINTITLLRNQLPSGLYFCKIFSNQYDSNPLKLIIK